MSQRAGISRNQAFEDFLHVVVCTLGRPLMEDEYLQTIARHTQGPKGKRSVDMLPKMFAHVVDAMEATRADILGDVFQGAITYGERGQFMTPEPVADMLARMTVPEEATPLEGRRSVCDPTCGSGRLLLAAARLQPHWHFVGQDVDLRCVRMCAINLALRNRYGHVVWGNSLAVETKLIYETGRLQVWGNAIRKAARVPLPDRAPEEIALPSPPHSTDAPASDDPVREPPERKSQLYLF